MNVPENNDVSTCRSLHPPRRHAGHAHSQDLPGHESAHGGFLRQRIMHPVYVAGVIVLAASTFRDGLTGTGAWLGLTEWLAGIVS